MRYLIPGILLIAVASCGVDATETGTNFFNEGVLDYSYSDTSSVNLSTITFEKLVTNGSTRLLVGTHDDGRLGRITAATYFQVMPSGAVNLEEEDVTFDYLALTLRYDEYSYYDTAQDLTLRAYYVNEEIELDDDGYLYSDDSFETEEQPLGSITFKPRPHHGDSIEIRLPDALGQEFFQKAITGSTEFSSASEFLDYFNGIALMADSTLSSSLIGLRTTPELRLYYNDRSVTPVEQRYISFSAAGVSSTKITTDRGTSALATLTDKYQQLDASATDDVAFLQSGAGLALRVDIPYLRALRQVENFYVLQAVLEVYTVRRSDTDFTALPSSLSVYKIDRDNTIYGQMDVGATLIRDVDLGRDTRYIMDVTSFVKEQMALQETNRNGLMFMIADNYAASVNRLYAASASSDYKTRLRIYYATLNN